MVDKYSSAVNYGFDIGVTPPPLHTHTIHRPYNNAALVPISNTALVSCEEVSCFTVHAV